MTATPRPLHYVALCMGSAMFEAVDDHKRVLLRDIAEPSNGAFVDGPFGSNLKSDEYVEAGVRLIQLQNIGEGYWKDDNKKYITDLKFK